MRLRGGLEILVLVAVTPFAAARYDLWHTIDDLMVVCDLPTAPSPLPTGMRAGDWPTAQEFAFQIGFDSGMDPQKPHIVTFFHSGTKPVNVTFQIDDKNGDSVVPSTTVELSPASSTSRSIAITGSPCACTGNNAGLNYTHYGQGYGTSCSAWDSPNCTQLHAGSLTPGPWCCQQWCYVGPNCPDSFPSSVVDGLRWSYVGACGETDTTSCTYQPPDVCAPINVDQLSQWSTVNITTFGAGYGSRCNTWDYSDCLEKYSPTVVDSWCCGAWKWVSAQCPSAIASIVWPGLYWSDAACPDQTAFVATCPYKKSAGINGGSAAFKSSAEDDPACECKGWTPPGLFASRRRYTTNGAAFPSTYGNSCSAWDAEQCSDLFPLLDMDIWCCRSWCYVDEDCKSANPSIIAGFFWSYESCPDDGLILTNCSFSDACQLTGKKGNLLAAELPNAPVDIGETCGAWDRDHCEEWYNDTVWWLNDSKDFCCKSWALVNQSCPIAEASTTLPGQIFWSYNICPQDTTNIIYDLATKTCGPNTTRRLGQVPSTSGIAGTKSGRGKLKLKLVEHGEGQRQGQEPEQDAAERRLSGRRRSFSSGRTGSSRRRASARRRTPTRVSDTSRRRFSTPRRRSATSSWTDARRRIPVSSPPRRRTPQSIARRRFSPAVPVDATGRRRAPTGVPSTNPGPRRRSTPAVASNLARRRSVPTFNTGGTSNFGSGSMRRRRTADVSGRRWNTEATRRRITAPVDSPRRRSTNFGFPDRQHLQHYYGYSVPAQTPYGYSGHGPSRNNVAYLAMAGAGGAALGVGGYYLYNQMRYNRWQNNVPYTDRSWCMVPEGTYQGRMIRCTDCGQRWNAARCKPYNDCWSGGCEFALPSDTRRDDLMNTGFIPAHYLPDLTVTITRIQGDDYRKSDICPPDPSTLTSGVFDDNWVKASTVRLSLYATLTEMENMNIANPGAASFSSGAATPVWPLVLSMMALVICRTLPVLGGRPMR